MLRIQQKTLLNWKLKTQKLTIFFLFHFSIGQPGNNVTSLFEPYFTHRRHKLGCLTQANVLA